MIDMSQKFHTKNLACLKGCYDQLCQMLRTGQAVLIMIHGYILQFLEIIYLYYGDAGMQIERCREDCYDIGNLQAAEEKISPKFLR